MYLYECLSMETIVLIFLSRVKVNDFLFFREYDTEAETHSNYQKFWLIKLVIKLDYKIY